MSVLLQYPVRVMPAEEGGFFVTSPVLPIFTQGETEEEALQNAAEAILCHIEAEEENTAQANTVRLTMVQVKVPDHLVA